MVYNGNPIKIDDLGVPLFLETPICIDSKKTTTLSLKGSYSKFPW